MKEHLVHREMLKSHTHAHTHCDTRSHKQEYLYTYRSCRQKHICRYSRICTRTHACRRTCMRANTSQMRPERTRSDTHKLQGLRESERELERVGCYLFISLPCSQEATSPRSCKHTETQASVSSNPGNNKWSPHTSMHTHMWDACTNTYTHAGVSEP